MVSYAMGGDNGFVIQHSNLTQGISIGYSTIKTSGTSANQNLTFYSQGTGVINLVSDTQVNGIFTALSTISGTTIYGSTAVCSPVGKFTTCLDLGGALTGTSATFSGGATFFNGGNTFAFAENVLNSGNADGAHIRNVVSTAANPTYAWAGDTDTGMYRDSANTIGFSTNGTNRLTIASTGAATFACSVTSPYYSFTGAIPSSAACTGYIDYSGGTTAYVLQSYGLTSDWLVAEPITKEESLLNIVYQPEVQSDIYIERGKNSATERTERLGEVDNIGDLVNYGYGFFKVVTQ